MCKQKYKVYKGGRMSENRTKQRLAYLDYIRVTATVMVTVLHCIYVYCESPENYGETLWKFLGYVNELTRMGVPLFFMISGYLTLSRDIDDFGAFYRKRFAKVGLPFIVYDVFYYLVGSANAGIEPTFEGYFKGFLASGNEYHLWFVYSIMFMYLLAPFLRRIVVACSEGQLWFLMLLATFQTTLRPLINYLFGGFGIDVYFTNDGFSAYMGYFILGYILGTHTEGKWVKRILYTLGILSFAIVPYITNQSIMTDGSAFFLGGYTINHYIEAAALFLFFKNLAVKPSRFVTELSNVSFSAYLIHVFIVEFMREIPLAMAPWKLMTVYAVVTLVLSFLWGEGVQFLVRLIKMLLEKLNRTDEPGMPDKRLR